MLHRSDVPDRSQGNAPGDRTEMGLHGTASATPRFALHPHQPRNVNLLHKAEHAASGFNTRLAVLLKLFLPIASTFLVH